MFQSFHLPRTLLTGTRNQIAQLNRHRNLCSNQPHLPSCETTARKRYPIRAVELKENGITMRSKARLFGSSTLAVGVLLLCGLPLTAQQPTLNHAQYSAVTPRPDQLAKLPQAPAIGFHEAPPLRLLPKRNFGNNVDPAQRSAVYPAEFAIGQNFLGVGNGFPGYSVPDAPPDTNMAVGDTQVLQWVNVSFTVCSKTGSCGPAILGNTLWQSLPQLRCAISKMTATSLHNSTAKLIAGC